MSVPILDADNRDPKTTWLWINQREYVEVNPRELMLGMIQNLPTPLDEKYERLFDLLVTALDVDLNVS